MDLDTPLEGLRELGNAVLSVLPRVGLALIVYALFHLAARGARALVVRVGKRYPHRRNVAMVLGRITQAAVILVGFLVSLSIVLPSFKAADVVQFLGIGSVAIGFAFRDILQNFLAGILLLLTEPFRIGDQIRYSDFEGTVEDIQTRATFIRTYDGRQVVIPNAALFTNAVTVNTAHAKRRTEYDVGIGVGDDVELAKQVILDALQGTPGILDAPPPEVLVIDLADFAVKLRVRWWVAPPVWQEILDSRDRVLARIKTRLIEEGIDLPFPTSQVLFHDQTEETDGDRRRQREGWPAGRGEPPRPRGLRRPGAGRGHPRSP